MEGEGKVPPPTFWPWPVKQYLLDNSGTHISIVASVRSGRRDIHGGQWAVENLQLSIKDWN